MKTNQPQPGLPMLPSAVNGMPMGEGCDEILTNELLAAKMKVSVATIENWTRGGHLPVIKKSKVVRFYWPDVLDHMRANFKPCPRGTVRPPLSK